MTDMNFVFEIGRLTRDPSLSYTAGGTALLKFSIAVNRSQKKGDGWEEYVSYFDVTVWGSRAENLHKNLAKGKQVAVKGYLDQQRWTDKEGKNQSRVVIVADSVQTSGGNQQQGYKNEAPQQYDNEIAF